MLTLEKLEIYRRFAGDIDGWARHSRPHESSGMTDADWYLIDALRTALHIVASGSAPPRFAAAVERKLRLYVADERTRKVLRKLAQPR